MDEKLLEIISGMSSYNKEVGVAFNEVLIVENRLRWCSNEQKSVPLCVEMVAFVSNTFYMGSFGFFV